MQRDAIQLSDNGVGAEDGASACFSTVIVVTANGDAVAVNG